MHPHNTDTPPSGLPRQDEKTENNVQTPAQSSHDRKTKPKKSKGQPKQAHTQQAKAKVDQRPLYLILGEQLLASTKPGSWAKSLPALDTSTIPIPPIPSTASSSETVAAEKSHSRTSWSAYRNAIGSKSTLSVTPRRSTDSTFSVATKIIKDHERPLTKYKVKGAIYNLNDLDAMHQIESLIQRYGRVAHMGVRDPSYSFWMNKSRTAVIHFKVLNKVAVLGGDPLCHPDRLALSLKEFETYCKSVGWKTAVMGASELMAVVAQGRGGTTMRFGTETVLNPQTNDVLLGKSGKRIVTQCRQLLDASKGGISVHTYCPNWGRDANIESELQVLYDDWRTARNASGEAQAFITVFELFAMGDIMTFLYTKNASGKINGFSALRQLGTDLHGGYHVDPFIQSADAPRGTSDLLIYASLALLNAKGVSYLSLGFEPLRVVGEISGLPSAFHGTTRKVYKHVFGKIPVGGKEAFHARWKPDTEQETPLFLVFVGKIPSPRFMVAMIHYTNISLRSIIKQDLEELGLRSRKEKKSDDSSSGSEEDSKEIERVEEVDVKGKIKVIQTVVEVRPLVTRS